MTLTAERLRELLDYDPLTGEFRRKVQRGRWLAGEIAGQIGPTGYRRIKVDGQMHMAHRLVWLHVRGHWPAEQLDHIDGQRDNNALHNLREATRNQNMQNMRQPTRLNTSGFLGVSQQNGRWRASIMVDGRKRHLGTFGDRESAAIAYVLAKREHHPFFAG